jgi:hypothetical protein
VLLGARAAGRTSRRNRLGSRPGGLALRRPGRLVAPAAPGGDGGRVKGGPPGPVRRTAQRP